jgi:hypothetical protein
MIGPLAQKPQGHEGQNLTRIDLAALSLISLLFGLAVIVRGLLHG